MNKFLNLAFLITSCAIGPTYSAIILFQRLIQLQRVYPEHIKHFTNSAVIWVDDTHMPLGEVDSAKSMQEKLDNPSLAEQLLQPLYQMGPLQTNPIDDPGRIRFEPFFRKMYGNSPDEVEKNLERIMWMPKTFGDRYSLWVTRVNAIHKKIQYISAELDELVLRHPEYIQFLDNPGGTYCWRTIAGTNRLSTHSFGMTLDINADQSQYWQWDLKHQERPISEEEPLTYRNTVPWEIVEIFEKWGFIWGGKFYHFDTMHFEYRPELLENPEFPA